MNEKQFSFTRAKLEKLTIPESGSVDYKDFEQPKLFCRVSASGNKSFLVRKRTNGKLRNITIGKISDWTVKDARIEAQNILLKLAHDEDPTFAKKQAKEKGITLRQLLSMYLESRSLSAYTLNDYKYKTVKYLEHWLDSPVNTITKNDVQTKFKELTIIGKTTANGTMRVFRALMNYAVASEILISSPVEVAKDARLWHKNKRKKRVIPKTKLAAWLTAVNELDNVKAKVYLLMIMFMGVRKRSALILRWADVNFAERTATFQTKTNEDVMLPIPDVLLAELRILRQVTGHQEWVFASDKHNSHMSVPKRQIENVSRKIGIQFSSHDCRRTFATITEACKLPTTLLKRMLDHATDADVTGGYVITEHDTLRMGFREVESFILKMCRDEEG